MYMGRSSGDPAARLAAFLADSAPDALRDRAFGWYFTLAFGIGSLWGTALGALIDNVGFQTTFFVMAGSYIAAALILTRAQTPRRA